jgi:peroxiredoxin
MEKIGTPIGSYAPDFELPGIDDSVHHLATYLEKFHAVGVIIMCNHCPFVRLYLKRLNQIQAEFRRQGFTLIGINANDAVQYPEDGFENMKGFAARNQLNFPYLRDMTQDVARSFGATRTPEVFLIDQSGILQYSGRIDDNAHDPEAVKQHYLRDAIAQVLNGGTPTPATTEPEGCSVKWRK